jgi:hypothetical protein
MKKKEKFDLSKFDNSIYPDDVLFDKEMDEKINKFFNNNNIEINEEESGSEIFINENLTFFEEDNKIYKELEICNRFVKEVLTEYQNMKNNLSKIEIDKKSELMITKKNYNIIPFPSDNILKTQILPYKSNKKLMKQILTIKNILFQNNKESINLNFTKLSEYLYLFLILLNKPLVDTDNSILYDLNKKIYFHIKKTKNQNITLKIIFIIIMEIFNQKINI